MNARPISTWTSRQRGGILALLLLAFALRCVGLDSQELRGDEAFGYFFSLPTPSEIVDQTLDLAEPHPVASYWLQHWWLGVAGHSEFALRFLGVWWSVLAVALMVPLATHLAMPQAAGSIGALLLALSPYTIWHAQDARMYNMSLALTLLSTLLAVRWWRGTGRRGWVAVAYLLGTWLALQTHYFALYVVAAQHVAFLGWAVAARAWRRLWLWWGMGILLVLAWLPWLWAARDILLGYQGNGDSPGLVAALVRAHSAFSVGEAFPDELRQWWAVLTLVLMMLGGAALWRCRSERAALWLLVCYWLIPLAATWLSAQSRPIFNERYLVAAVPPVFLLMAAAIDTPRPDGRRWLAWLARGLTILLVVGMVWGIVRQSSDPLVAKTRGWRELATTLDVLAAGVELDAVRLAQNYPDPTLWYYYQGEVAHLTVPPAANDAARSAEEVRQMVEAGVTRVILVEQPAASWDGTNIAHMALSKSYTFADTVMVAQWPVSLWLRPTDEMAAMAVEYVGGLQLLGASINPPVLPPGGALAVDLQWQGAAGSVGADEAVSVQLLDAQGTLVAQRDRPLLMASETTAHVATYAILLPTTLDAGDYQVALVVYDPGQAGAPRRLTVQGAESVVIGTVLVEER